MKRRIKVHRNTALALKAHARPGFVFKDSFQPSLFDPQWGTIALDEEVIKQLELLNAKRSQRSHTDASSRRQAHKAVVCTKSPA